MPGLKEPLIGEDQTKAKAKWQKLVFLITFLNYAMAHFSRKCYTNVKTDLMASGVDKIILSQMDTAFMFTYAIGSFISGRLGDTFPQNVVIGVGLLGSTLCTAAPSEMVTVAMSRTAGRLAPGRHAWAPGRSPHLRGAPALPQRAASASAALPAAPRRAHAFRTTALRHPPTHWPGRQAALRTQATIRSLITHAPA